MIEQYPLKLRRNVKFVSVLDESYGEQLKELFFFNPMQGRYRKQICHVIDAYGSPAIEESITGLRIRTEKLPDLRNIFMLSAEEHKLLAGLLYYRTAPNILELLHIATVHSKNNLLFDSEDCLVITFLRELSHAVSQISGIEFLGLPYRFKRIPVRFFLMETRVV